MVGAGFDKDEILVAGIYFLELLYLFQHYIVHAMFVATEDALCFYTYFHFINVISFVLQ